MFRSTLLKLQISLEFHFSHIFCSFFPSALSSPSAPTQRRFFFIDFPTINISLNNLEPNHIIACLQKYFRSAFFFVRRRRLLSFIPSHPRFLVDFFLLAAAAARSFATFRCCHNSQENYYCKVSENNEAMNSGREAMTVFLCFLPLERMRSSEHVSALSVRT